MSTIHFALHSLRTIGYRVDLSQASCTASSYNKYCDRAYTNGEWYSSGEGVGLWLEVIFPVAVPVAKVRLNNRGNGMYSLRPNCDRPV